MIDRVFGLVFMIKVSINVIIYIIYVIVFLSFGLINNFLVDI